MALHLRAFRNEHGMNTAEYTMGPVAACAFGCALIELIPRWRLLLLIFLNQLLDATLGGWLQPW